LTKKTFTSHFFHIKKGILLDKEEFVFDYVQNFLEQFLMRYYDDQTIPKEIILSKKVDDSVAKALSELSGSRVKLSVPLKGEKYELLELVKTNIQATYFASEEALLELQKAINLQEPPKLIECFDISHISGTSTVASMVQFRNAKPDKNNYRRFKIKTVDGNDDFASMAEVVTRRYTKLKLNKEPFPDLIVIDGGKGQLSSALSALNHIGVKIPILALAKKQEEIFVPGKNVSIQLSKKNKGLQLLQRMRDEAHRFAISYNRFLRKKKLLKK
jgi:excinuclease ABC subunit C